MNFFIKPNRRETIWGYVYLALYLSVLSRLIPLAAYYLAPQLNSAQVNFLYFTINFLATVLIFRKYLKKSLQSVLSSPLASLAYALLGYLVSRILGGYLSMLILRLEPAFANVNDAAIRTMVSSNFALMAIGAVILAPVTEELLFRGLIFRGLYDRSPVLAHLASICLFSLIHVTNYIGVYDWKLLGLCFLQYLVPACCLNFAYRCSGNILTPIFMHGLTNLIALWAMPG